MAEQLAEDLKLEARVLVAPIWPCRLLKHGAPGLVLIGGRTYAVAVLGAFLKREDRAEVVGFRVLTDEGKTYDVTTGEHGPTCDCGDANFRARPGGCRHVVALRQIGLLDELAEHLKSMSQG